MKVPRRNKQQPRRAILFFAFKRLIGKCPFLLANLFILSAGLLQICLAQCENSARRTSRIASAAYRSRTRVVLECFVPQDKTLSKSLYDGRCRYSSRARMAVDDRRGGRSRGRIRYIIHPGDTRTRGFCITALQSAL